jgi:REP element-mobilizing transposase RayT
MDENDDSNRKHPVHWPARERHNLSVILFVSVCTQKRKPILANPAAVQVLLDAWQAADHWLVGRYVILPDHLHLFCTPAHREALGVHRWVAFWKSHASKRWPVREQHPIWQIDCWDTQLRQGESYSAKWDYVCNNPVRHGLVRRAEDWPYQGELNVLPWHDP